MSNYDQPDRFDLEKAKCSETERDCIAELTRHRQGDWVAWSDYEELLGAYQQRGEVLEEIRKAAENA